MRTISCRARNHRATSTGRTRNDNAARSNNGIDQAWNSGAGNVAACQQECQESLWGRGSWKLLAVDEGVDPICVELISSWDGEGGEVNVLRFRDGNEFPAAKFCRTTFNVNLEVCL